LPREAILSRAGGWPARGGGVVLPSNGCEAAGFFRVSEQTVGQRDTTVGLVELEVPRYRLYYHSLVEGSLL
jgi:hypothetical protein